MGVVTAPYLIHSTAVPCEFILRHSHILSSTIARATPRLRPILKTDNNAVINFVNHLDDYDSKIVAKTGSRRLRCSFSRFTSKGLFMWILLRMDRRIKERFDSGGVIRPPHSLILVEQPSY